MMLNLINSFPSNFLVNKRIIGGWRANITEYPHVVQILHKQQIQGGHWFRPACGGSILNKYWVLTAAHCIHGYPIQDSRIQYGLSTFGPTIDRSRTFRASVFIEHSNFNKTKLLEDDIGLIKINGEFSFSSFVKSISLIGKDEAIESTFSISTGFIDSVNEKNQRIRKLGIVNVHIKNNSICEGSAISEANRTICGLSRANHSTCWGDSGSGLLSIRDNGEKILIGIVSYGMTHHTCYLSVPLRTVFTRVSYYLDWIRDSMQNFGYF